MLRLLLLTLLLFMPSIKVHAQPAFPAWRTIESPAEPSEITALGSNPETDRGLLAASEEAIYAFSDTARWTSVWRNGKTGVHAFQSFSELPGHVFALTDKGAVLGDLQNKKWREVFFVSGQATPVLSWAVMPGDPDHWIAGTAKGLYESDDGGRSWEVFETFRTKDPVIALYFRYRQFWVITANSVYATSDLRSFRQVFFLPETSAESEAEEFSGEESFGPESFRPSILTAEASNETAPRIWVGTTRGVFEQDPESGFWERLPGSGLSSGSVRHLAFSSAQNRLLAGTDSGIYYFDSSASRWEKFPSGLSLHNIQTLRILPGSTEVLASASPRGIFLFPLSPDITLAPAKTEQLSSHAMQELQNLIRAEPSVRDIQNAVIRASNSGHGKIHRWQKQSRLRAFFPSVSFGRDFSWGNNIDIDRGGTNDPDTYITGPEQVDRGWDIDVSWDLGELVWGSAQTSIDSRDKITAEFRNDLLSEATRLYYERRRLQMDMAASGNSSTRAFYENLLRLEELTALLDAMTDGYLTEALRRARTEYSSVELLRPA